MHFPLTDSAWMLRRLFVATCFAVAMAGAVSTRAQSDPVPPTHASSTINQSLSLDDGSPVEPPERSDDAVRAEQAAESSGHNRQTPAANPSEPLILPQRGALASDEEGSRGFGSDSALNIKSLGALAVVLVLMVGAVLLLRRFIPSLRIADHAALRIVARAGLTSKQSLALVRVGRRYVLIGIGGDGLRCLCEIDDPEETAQLSAHFGIARPSPESFDQLLARELGDQSADRPPDNRIRSGGMENDTAQGLSGLRSRLRALKAG